jgi:DNA-binding GntR family transcriptional regulator
VNRWVQGGQAVSLLELLEDFRHAATIADAVYGALRHAIIHGGLAPGARLRADPLAKEMKVSRTPVREALRKLEVEGLATMSPRRGLIVRELSEADLIESSQIRAVLEGLAARLAADNATPTEVVRIQDLVDELGAACRRGDVDLMRDLVSEFLQLVYKASHNERLLALLTALQDSGRQFRSSTLYRPGRPQQLLDAYRELLKAIAAHDGGLAEQLARGQRDNVLALCLQMAREQKRNRRATDHSEIRSAPSNDDLED